MTEKLLKFHYATSINARNILESLHKTRPLASVQKKFKIYCDDDPFHYKNIVKFPDEHKTKHKKQIKQIENHNEETQNQNLNDNNNLNEEYEDFKRIESAPLLETDEQEAAQKKEIKKKKVKLHKSATLKNDKPSDFMYLSVEECGYLYKKRQLNKRIHSHYNQDSVSLNLDKTADYKIPSEWITIIDTSGRDENDELRIFDSPTEDNVYQSTTDVGVAITQRLDKGLKIMVCRNGEAVQRPKSTYINNDIKPLLLPPPESPTSFDQDSSDNRSAITRILRDMTKKDVMPLSWADQEKRNGIKVLHPRRIIEKKIEIPIHEKKIFPKKLIEEDEFRPKIRVDYPTKYKITQIVKPKVTSVEITGTDDNRRAQSRHQYFNSTSNHLYNTDNSSTSSNTTWSNQNPGGIETISRIRILPKDGIHHKKSAHSGVSISLEGLSRKEEESLSDENYKQIIDNLTRHYVGHKNKAIVEQPFIQLHSASDSTDASQRQTQTQTDRVTTANLTSTIDKSETDTEVRINLQAIANDYALAAEIENRKRMIHYQAQRLLQHLNPKSSMDTESKSRPNSPNPLHLSIGSRKREPTVMLRERTNLSRHANFVTRASTSTPISDALKATLKSSKETVYINFAITMEPSTRILPQRSNPHTLVQIPPVRTDPELLSLSRRPFR